MLGREGRAETLLPARLDRGVDIIKLPAMLGHRHITTKQIYETRRQSTSESASRNVPIPDSAVTLRGAAPPSGRYEANLHLLALKF